MDLTALAEKFENDLRIAKQFHPISSVELLQEVVAHTVGHIVADVGCGAGMPSHLLKLNWRMTDAFRLQQIMRLPYVIGIDVNAWSNQWQHNYDLFLQGLSTELPLPDKSVDTILCTEVVEHLMHHEVPATLHEFERVARCRIIITTPSPLRFLNVQTFQDRAMVLAHGDIQLTQSEFALLASAVHKTFVKPDWMAAHGYRLHIHRGKEFANHPLYIRDLQPVLAPAPPLPDGADFQGAAASARDFSEDRYVELLRAEYPVDVPAMSTCTGRTSADIQRLVEADARNGNYRADYLNLICASLKENDSISEAVKEQYRVLLQGNSRRPGLLRRIKRRLVRP